MDHCVSVLQLADQFFDIVVSVDQFSTEFLYHGLVLFYLSFDLVGAAGALGGGVATHVVFV